MENKKKNFFLYIWIKSNLLDKKINTVLWLMRLRIAISPPPLPRSLHAVDPYLIQHFKSHFFTEKPIDNKLYPVI